MNDLATPPAEELVPEAVPEEIDEGSAPSELSGEEPAEEVDEAPKPKTAVQKRIDDLTRKRHEAERRAAYAEGQLAAQKETPAVTPETPALVGEPRQDDYEDYDAYRDARNDWAVTQQIERFKAEQAAETQKKSDADAKQDFNQRLQEGNARYNDFEAVAMNPAIPITASMVGVLRESEIPADMAYYLGGHMEEAIKISHMTPVQAATALGKLEQRLSVELKKNPPKPTKVVSSAPAPIKPTGSGEVVSKDPDKMTNEEYRVWRRAQ